MKVGGTMMDEPVPYAVIIDRISHEVPYYRSYLKNAVLQGVKVINNPFMWTADDKYFEASLATKLGIASPKTVVLPNKEYVPGIIHPDSLRNLDFVNWDALLDYVGLPCVLKDAHGGGWRDVYICHSKGELIHNFDQSGLLTMIVQEFIEWDQYIRCMCLGQQEVLPIRYDPKERKYHVEDDYLSPQLRQQIITESLALVRALGYDMNTVEWAVRGGVPYAIDFMNPAPDMDIYSLTPHYFEWAVKGMADMAIRLAKESAGQLSELRWNSLF
jgi:D-alanine-D-alanine ligase-like ATP-grasp enzyme